MLEPSPAVSHLDGSDFYAMSLLTLKHLEVVKYSWEDSVAEFHFGGKKNTIYTRLWACKSEGVKLKWQSERVMDEEQ